VPIVVRCKCGKVLRAPESLGGKTVRCPACKTPLRIPAEGPAANSAAITASSAEYSAPPLFTPPQSLGVASPESDDDFENRLAPPETPVGLGAELAAASSLLASSSCDFSATAAKQTTAVIATKTAGALGREAILLQQGLQRRNARRFLYLLFALTLVPLVVSTLHPDDTIERVGRTLQAHPELETAQIDSEASLFRTLPDERFEGAHLSYFTKAHWLYAAISAAAFLGLMLLCFELGRAKAWQLAVVALVTATVGILFLVIVQWIASVTDGQFLISRNPIILVIFYVAKFIGFSYSAALNPEYGFWMSFFGFTFGVGLCEELTKALPILFVARSDAALDWRAAAVWGLASGVGFGVAEGILYSSDYYNGVATGEMYVVRFVSCVGLHGMWAAAVGIMIARCRDDMQKDWDWSDLAIAILKVQAVPMVLHGLYDVMLKKEMTGWAIGVAVLSFVWLAVLIEWCRREESGMMARNAARWSARAAT
jgi:RsiW-degrading membrane proteinase PrsW (M82 family)